MLTDTQCRTAKPKTKPYKLTDGKGLYLEIKSNGVKAWRYRFELREGDVAKESIFAIGDYAIAPSGETPEEAQARRVVGAVWFHCPAQGCGRCVAKLYLGGAIFACRHCYRLAYSSQRENLDDRATRRADKIRERLKWEPGILNGHGIKPKGMHWRTYQRLTAKHDALVDVSLKCMARRFELTERGLAGVEELLNRDR